MWVADEDFEMLERALTEAVAVELGRAAQRLREHKEDKHERHIKNSEEFRRILRELRLTKRSAK